MMSSRLRLVYYNCCAVVLLITLSIIAVEATLLPEECSSDLRWQNNREHCQKESNWTPRSVLWDHFVNNKNEPMNDSENDENPTDRRADMIECIDKAMHSYRLLRELNAIDVMTPSSRAKNKGEKNNYDISPHIVREFKHPDTDKILAVEVADAISEEMAYAVKSLAGCARKFLAEISYEHRPFGSGGGNDCTFIQSLAQIFLPAIPAHVQKVAEFVYEEVGWKDEEELPPPGTLGMRTMEHLNYGAFPKGLGSHSDQGSIYTVLFSLTDPKHYEGGEYYIEITREEMIETSQFKPDKYSAMVFLSETVHGVDPIPSGHREMFTNELWPLLDVAFPMNRPDEDDFEVYNDWINDAIEADENPLSVPYPELRETDAWLAERNRVRQNDVDYENEFEEDEDPRDDDDDEYDGADYEDEPDSTHDSIQ